jgi:23S rRNA pseudouridine2604 synthase
MTNVQTYRVNKRMKDLGLSSRREADQLIEAGMVLVNGKVAVLGDQVSESDVIEIKQVKNAKTKDGKNITIGKKQYIAFYKPKGVVSHSPQYEEKQIKDFFPNFDADGLTIIGRLDKHSEGLILLTNDKRLVERILDPKYDHEKEYIVEVQEKLSSNIERLFKKGFEVRGRFTARPATVTILDTFTFSIILTEGKKHQIRLMTNELHYTVSKLLRVRVMNVELGKMKAADQKSITGQVLKNLLASLDLK